MTGREALALAARDLDRRPVLIVSDFDGTLSEIVNDPWGATIIAGARRALRRLAAIPDVHVAILSGRAASDVVQRARVGGALYLGNHGLERGRLARRARASSLAVESDPSQRRFQEEVERIAEAVARRIDAAWLIVELKGPAVAFHYRNAPDLTAAASQVEKTVDELDPGHRFDRFPGRRVLELRPPGATEKGAAIRTLLDEVRPAATFVLGDDRSDAQAFGVLREARDAGRARGLSLAVQAHAESPPEVAAAADGVLDSPREAARFLSGLARRLSSG